MEVDKPYRCIVSLGFFCSIAMDSETMKCRTFSGPFDWLITDDFEKTVFEGVTNSFKDFFRKKDFYQGSNYINYFYNQKYNYWVYHDFNGQIPLLFQFNFVKRKYKRRCKKFLTALRDGHILFIRYCANQKEIDYIVNNKEKIKAIFENNGSKILFICNDTLLAPDDFFKVPIDNNDTVNRSPLYSNKILNEYLETNVIKTDKKVSKYYRIKNKLYRIYIKALVHCKKIVVRLFKR